ncbi:(d)CMP kinase [Effusibacillus consociatus]|uniref:Cytidylate kinase n=1 Tax=Effusibacillus consociatus TaxID=1117041 RepID=A0ABV9Q2Y3_9BACL
MNEIRVAIDGPAGAGKSTVAKMVARRLGLLYIDTGAMYRAVTWKAIEEGIPLSDEQKLVELASNLHIRLQTNKQKQSVFVNDTNVTEQIRSKEVTEHVSTVSAIPGVRTSLVKMQQKLAQEQGVVMDGRDIGTCVIPDAEVKIFLTASLEERARRRMEELIRKGVQVDFEELKSSIAKRDEMDSSREFAPLRKAEDAYSIDTTNLSLDEVVEQIVSICEKQIGTKL